MISVHHRQSIRLALFSLAVLNAGGAVPFGISEITTEVDADPNWSEWVLSGLFAVAGLVALVGIIRVRTWLGEVAFASGALWFVAASYVAFGADIDDEARAGFGLIFAGIGLGCFALWQRLRAEADRLREIEP